LKDDTTLQLMFKKKNYDHCGLSIAVISKPFPLSFLK